MPRQDRSKTVRLFVGIYPPAEVVTDMLEQARALDLPSSRFTALEQVHLTLQFIGDRPAHRVDEVIETIQRARKGLHGFTLQPERLISLPDHGPPPRLIAATTSAPADLLELQRRLARRLARQGRDKPGDRYLPHITLARFHRGKDTSAARGLVEPCDDLPSFEVKSIRLMKSVLLSKGARHDEVALIPLSP